nr:MAG TPA_asm: hypothetical protein [Caudoviricetes sp.]DAL61308.1 MAG TPA_asm: hypothetical protein [Bacteriophage sp.]
MFISFIKYQLLNFNILYIQYMEIKIIITIYSTYK